METKNLARKEDLIPADIYGRAVRYWWLVTIFIIAGGAIGLLVSALAKPLYESTAHVTTVMDFAHAGRMTDYEEDHLLSAIGDIINSDEVMNRTAASAVEDGLAPTLAEALAGLSASRQGYRWEMSSRSHDPRLAQQLNQLWLDASMEALDQFRRDSLIALKQLNAQAEVEACFQQSVSLEPVSPYCTVEEMQALIRDLQNSEDIARSGSLSAGLLASRISFQVTRAPNLPSQPVHFNRKSTVMAGMAIGLIAVVSLFLVGLPVGFSGKKK